MPCRNKNRINKNKSFFGKELLSFTMGSIPVARSIRKGVACQRLSIFSFYVEKESVCSACQASNIFGILANICDAKAETKTEMKEVRK